MVTNSIDPFERMPFLRCTENSHSVLRSTWRLATCRRSDSVNIVAYSRGWTWNSKDTRYICNQQTPKMWGFLNIIHNNFIKHKFLKSPGRIFLCCKLLLAHESRTLWSNFLEDRSVTAKQDSMEPRKPPAKVRRVQVCKKTGGQPWPNNTIYVFNFKPRRTNVCYKRQKLFLNVAFHLIF